MITQDELSTLAVRDRLVQLLRETGILASNDPAGYQGSLFSGGRINSMDVPYLLALVEEEFGVDIDETLLAVELTTLDAIAAYIAARRLDDAA